MKILLLLLILIISACSCKQIKYEADHGTLNSAQANSLEYLVYLNNTPCIDMDKKVGLCAKRIPSDTTLTFKIDPRPYEYKISIECSKAVDADKSFTIIKNSSFKYEILPEKFKGIKSFTCIGEIIPSDRDQEISASWMARIVVFDEHYLPRTSIYEFTHKKKRYLVMGKHARYSYLNGKWYRKKTIFKLKKKENVAYSESERMRFNYWNIK